MVFLFRQMAESLEAFSTNHAEMFEGAEGMDVEDGEHRYATSFTCVFQTRVAVLADAVVLANLEMQS